MALCLVFILRLFQFSHFFRISNFFDLSITEETWVVKIRIWCINILNALVLHMRLLFSFHRNCLWEICRIFWRKQNIKHQPPEIDESQLYSPPNKKMCFRWPEHAFRMSNSSITKTALRWTPQGKRRRGQPKWLGERSSDRNLENY
jgi:hypothetical protein